MKQGTTALIVMALTVAGGGAAFAQVLAPMNGPPGAYAYYYDHYDRPVPPPPPHEGPMPYDPAMPAYEVRSILRSTGFRPLGAPSRRGRFYVISAIHPNGDDGRLVIDAYSGRIVRFTPASDVIRASRNAPMVMVYQGPTFPPPSAALPPMRSMPGVSRPPSPVPRLASRSPSSAPLVTPKPRPASAPPKPETAQAPPTPAPVESKPAAPSPPLEKKPSEAAVPPAKSVVQPTRPLPPVQTME